MKKNDSTIANRTKFVKDSINSRPVGEKIESVVRDLADKLFLSPFTIWKDYQREQPSAPKGKQSNRY